ncbi:hypothetical protein RvY_03289 [Ramazzottius varieornatus]|uniref:RUN domain-containing protein n=1 Tax=Ramazzottius varieornatus TaxID=947166 RepID=A0A1D1UNC3_RAMVA|nr:hypothetical protein RvY_03289 [Ramazzottius varieornatus]
MMQEVPVNEDGHQWASFSSFDFTQLPKNDKKGGVVECLECPPKVDQDQALLQLEDVWINLDQQSLPSDMEYSQQTEHSEAKEMDLYSERMQEMEEQQEMLNSSLLSLTTHFAQVQFRLKQISSTADPETKEALLKDLERFAFEGVPEIAPLSPQSPKSSGRRSIGSSDFGVEENEEKSEVYTKQVMETKDLITRLQKQLTEVEQWAYESGQSEAPSLSVLKNQKLILDTLRERVKLSVDGYEQLSDEEMRVKVDQAVESIIVPFRQKEMAQEKTVERLQTFVHDLERYVQHLQGQVNKASVDSPKKSTKKQNGKEATNEDEPSTMQSLSGTREPVDPRSRASVGTLFDRAYNVLHFFALINWTGCLRDGRRYGSSNGAFHRNTMKRTVKGNHWGDSRAALQVAIGRLLEACKSQPVLNRGKKGRKEVVVEEDALVVRLVRKDLAAALMDLMRHGLMQLSNDSSLVPRMMLCTSPRSDEPVELHPWDFLIKYYAYKRGKEFNCSATKKLSDSFQLSRVGATVLTPVDQLLSLLGTILDSHQKFQTSSTMLFRAFLCAALNRQCLSTWLRLIYCTKPLVDEYYMPWSYAIKTHFEDACQSLEGLQAYTFNLPTDLAIRSFSALDEAF